MCLALIALDTHPRYRLIVAANRDEFYRRPTAQAAWWEDAPELLAGCDLEQGGSWLGVTRSGRYALVTNYRSGDTPLLDGAPSRGLLVTDFLLDNAAPANYLESLQENDGLYNGYNLIIGDPKQLWYHSNRSGEIKQLPPGVYGLSNHLLDTPWPKVKRGKETLFGLLEEEGETLIQGLFTMLWDHTRADDAHLPDTGISIEWERLLSSAFIVSEDYGTRSSTVVLVEKSGKTLFIERSYGPGGQPGSTLRYEF